MKTKTLPNGFVSLIAEEGFCMVRRDADIAECAECREVAVKADQADQWTEVAALAIAEAKEQAEAERKYAERVVALIRRRYSQSDEDAIKRKMLATIIGVDFLSEHQSQSIIDEFKEYNHYAELCKKEAKE